jgi:glycogen synthase
LNKRPRAVALFASSFHPHVGGVEEVVRCLAHQQAAAGGSPLVLTTRWPNDLPAEDTFEGISVRRHVFRLPERKPRWLAAYALENRRIQRAINRQLVHHGADLVHVHCVTANAWYAYRAARELDLPLVVTMHGELSMDANHAYERSGVLSGLLSRVLNEADAVTACSRDTLDEAQSFTGIDLGARGSVVPSGVDVAELRNAVPAVRDTPYVLAIGRHVHQKGFDILIEAWAQVQDSMDEPIQLVIAGDGPEHDSLVARARKLGLEGSIEFPGRCDRPTTASLFAGCRAFVLPSRHEPFGIVNLEAMAAGKPIVATRVGGVAEVVDANITGLLVPPEDGTALAVALINVLTTPCLATRLGQRGAERSDAFDWARVAAQYEHVYERL